MTDIPSVLLIVGSVLVGPVEARPTGNTIVTDPPKTEYESVKQLCERAMKEIGATQVWAQHPGQRFFYWRMDKLGDDGVRRLSEEVRCIPTPKGYRK